MNNWMTSLAGVLAGSPFIADALQTAFTFHYSGNWKTDLASLGALVLGVAAKDFNVTGGTVRQ